MTEEQGELFEQESYDLEADEALFEGVDLSAFGEALEERDSKLISFLREQLEKAGGKDIGIEALLKRAEKGTLALSLELMRLKRRLPK